MRGRHDQASERRAAGTDVNPPSLHPADTASPSGDPPVADVLSDVLEAVRLTGALFFLVDALSPWVAGAPEGAALASVLLPRVRHVVSYHVILEGTCWCRMAAHAPLRLEAGDTVVVPHGDAYLLSSAPGVPSDWSDDQSLAWFREMAQGRLPVVVKEGGASLPRIRVVCGFLGCDALPFNPVLATLPRMLRVGGPSSWADDGSRPSDKSDGDTRPLADGHTPALSESYIGALVDLAVGESRDARAGGRSVLLRLGELLFIEVVRRHLSALTPESRGWLAGLRDPVVGRALVKLHERPGDAWTMETLAREAASSRSILAERFTHLVGEPPMHYLARWRMQLAAGLLVEGGAKVSSVGREVGYDSEAAFSRAFKKLTGVAPAAWRDRHASAPRAHRP